MTSTLSQISYRRDIDGLRALAVLAVVLFHADTFGMQGGFVGVDIFFVISGYLITAIIASDLAAREFSIARFYERRIRRIVPALVVMMAITSVAAVLFLPPHELANFGKSAVAGSAFSANLYFAHHTGYFAGAEEGKPLLHLWSLGVEEQFYILWPLLLFACWRRGWSSGVKGLVVGLGAASFAHSEWLVAAGHAPSAFFLPQSRIWELMLGAALALGAVPDIARRRIRDGLGLLGLGLIALAFAIYSRDTPFPGLHAALPCLGAALLIHTGRHGDTAAAKLLGLRPIVWVGMISYSLYLWHWPIFAYAKFYLGRPLGIAEIAAAIAASVAIAAASWRYVEQPIRNRKQVADTSIRHAFAAGLGALAAAGSLGALLYISGGLPGRLDEEAQRFAFAYRNTNPLRPKCHTQTDDAMPRPLADCARPTPGPGGALDIVVWGDSHGDAIFPAISVMAESYGLIARQVTKSSCPPLVGARWVGPSRIDAESCLDFNRNVMRQLEDGPRPSLAILSGRWSLYTETLGAEGRRGFLIDEQQSALDVATSREVLSRALARTVAKLNELGVSVLLLGQTPEFAQDPNACFVRRRIQGRDTRECLSQPRRSVEDRLRASTEILTRVAEGGSRAMSVNLAPFLCDENVCWAARDERPLYVDDDHVSAHGAEVIGAALMSLPEVLSLLAPDATKTAAGAKTTHLTNWSSGPER